MASIPYEEEAMYYDLYSFFLHQMIYSLSFWR